MSASGPAPQTVLDEGQFAQLQAFQKPRLLKSLGRVNQPVWGRSGPFYHWLIDFYFFVILPLNCVRACGALIRDELQADTLGFLTTRPVSRARLLVVKYLSQTAWVQILMLVETLLLFAAGHLRHIPALDSLLPLFFGRAISGRAGLERAGAFLGQVTKRYMALAMVYGFIVEMGIGRIPTNINTLSLMRSSQDPAGEQSRPAKAFTNGWPQARLSRSGRWRWPPASS